MKKMQLGLCLAAMVIAFTLAPGVLMAATPAWSSFHEAVFSGITVDEAPGGLSYVLTLSGAPTVTFGGSTYNVTWCQGFFLLDPTGAETIWASQGTSPAGWDFDGKTDPEPYSVIGWEHPAKDGRLLPGGAPATFTLGRLSASAGTIYGYHLGYTKADGTAGLLEVYTEKFKTPVPEPGSLVVTATMLAGMVGFIRRRRVT